MKIKTDFYKLEGCGLTLIPTIRVEFTYSRPTIRIEFWSFQASFHFYHRFSSKFMDFWEAIAYFQLPKHGKEEDA